MTTSGGGPEGPTSPTSPLRVVVEFDPGAELAGRLRLRDGDVAEFAGRLELYAALERARKVRPVEGDTTSDGA